MVCEEFAFRPPACMEYSTAGENIRLNQAERRKAIFGLLMNVIGLVLFPLFEKQLYCMRIHWAAVFQKELFTRQLPDQIGIKFFVFAKNLNPSDRNAVSKVELNDHYPAPVFITEDFGNGKKRFKLPAHFTFYFHTGIEVVKGRIVFGNGEERH